MTKKKITIQNPILPKDSSEQSGSAREVFLKSFEILKIFQRET